MKGNEVLALICKAQNAEHFTEFSAKVLGGSFTSGRVDTLCCRI